MLSADGRDFLDDMQGSRRIMLRPEIHRATPDQGSGQAIEAGDDSPAQVVSAGKGQPDIRDDEKQGRFGEAPEGGNQVYSHAGN